MQAFFIRGIDAGLRGALLVDVFGARGKRVNIFAAVFGRADSALGSAKTKILFIKTQILDAVLDQLERVVLVVDREGAGVFVIQLLSVLTQNAHARTIEG